MIAIRILNPKHFKASRDKPKHFKASRDKPKCQIVVWQMGDVFKAVGDEQGALQARKALQNGQRPQEGPNIPGM